MRERGAGGIEENSEGFRGEVGRRGRGQRDGEGEDRRRERGSSAAGGMEEKD